MATSSDCKAKDPSTCPYHGALKRMEQALEAKDTNAYLKAYGEAQANTNKRSLKSFLKGEENRPPVTKASDTTLRLLKLQAWEESILTSGSPEMQQAVKDARASVEEEKKDSPEIQAARRKARLAWLEGN